MLLRFFAYYRISFCINIIFYRFFLQWKWIETMKKIIFVLYNKMSCYSKCYNPVPPREWNRFQNICTFNRNAITPNATLQIADNYKGNILQYKKNSSNLTKNQRYAQIARGMWTNRTTSWATQTESYTNPNTNSLKRANATEISVPISNTPYGYPTIPCPDLINTATDTITVLDGGTLVCNIVQNPCTGKETITGGNRLCFPTSD